ncbi:RNA-binding protein [Gorillibacterium sp. sgz5001074]|uniref:YlmH family RNA-binding protein n=1 Tax=Gorillibacterium sp. sgz5001074 TaxID=3446695 RepID=UPI003F67D810
MDKEFYSHFQDDEKAFVDKAWDWIRRAEDHSMKRTDFLDPRQCHIITTLANRAEVRLRLDGGHPDAERKRAVITPDYRDPEEEDIGIRVLSVTSPDGKLAELEHGDFLGAILGLGIKRDKVGDVHIHSGGCHILVAAEIADYFTMNLNQVHRVSVSTELLPPDKLILSSLKLEEMTLSVASLRMDGIVSDVWRLSRAKVLVPIKAGRCRLNWKVEEDPSAPLKDGDVVSLQGFGRFKVLEVEGMTKKGRMRVRIGKYV